MRTLSRNGTIAFLVAVAATVFTPAAFGSEFPVTIDVSGPLYVQEATPYTYTVTLKNIGIDAREVFFQEYSSSFPDQFETVESAVSSQGSCELKPTYRICSLGTLASGGTATIAFRATPAYVGGYAHHLAAMPAASGGVSSLLDYSVDSTGAQLDPPTDIRVAIIAPLSAVFRGTITYQVTATNADSIPATGVTLYNRLDAYLSFVSVNSPSGGCGQPNNQKVVTCTFGTLMPGASVALTLVASPDVSSLETPVAFSVELQQDWNGTTVTRMADSAQVEVTPPILSSICSDGLDNDGDGKTDYPADAGCASPSDNDERGSELLKNAGFELDGNGDGRPDNWTSNAHFTRTNVLVAAGAYAARHRATDNAGYTIKQSVAAGGGKTYRFAGQVNVPTTTDTFTFRVQVRWRNASGATITTKTLRTYSRGTSGWDRVGVSLQAPSSATSADIRMAAGSLNATIYVDDFSFALV